MPFVITRSDQEDQEEENTPGKGFVVSPREKKEDTSFSFMKDILGPAKEFGVGAINLASQAFGGGPDSPMAMEEHYRMQMKQREYDQKAQGMKEQGATEEVIQEQLGNRPDMFTLSEFIDEKTGGALLPENARQRMTQQAGKEAGEFVTAEAIFPGGSSLKSLAKWAGIGGLFGLGEQVAEEAGGEEGSKLATGLTFAAAPFLLKKGYGGLKNAIEWGRGLLKQPALEGVPSFLTESGTPKALAELELTSKNLSGRVAQTSEEMLSKFEEQVGKVAEPSFKDVGTFRAADVEKELVKANQKAILDTISPASETQKKAWEGLQEFVNENFNASKEAYSKLYEVVEQASKDLPVIPRNTYEAASKVYNDLQQSIIKAPEEGGVKKALEEVVNTLKPMAEGNLVEIPLDQLMAGKRSINRLLSKSDIIPAPIDLLKPVSRAMKLDTMAALESKPAIKRAFEAAEETFTKAQDVFNNDALVKMRKSETPEKLTSMFSEPSNLQKLKKATGDNNAVDNFIDRLVVENIASKNKATAQEMARESREFLGKKGQEALDKIMEYGDTLASPGQQSLARGRVLEDLQKAFDVGSRPKATLDMMKNRVGYDLVKDTLNRSPRGKKMWKSLQRMTFEDMVSSVIGKDKQIDFEKAKDILSDPHLKSVVKEALGEEGMRFFTQMEQYGKNISQNLKRFDSQDKGLFEKISENYLDKGLKYGLYAMAPGTFGKSLLPLLGVELGKRAHRARLFKILENPQSRKVVKELGAKNISPKRMAVLLKQLSQVAGRPSEEEQEDEN